MRINNDVQKRENFILPASSLPRECRAARPRLWIRTSCHFKSGLPNRSTTLIGQSAYALESLMRIGANSLQAQRPACCDFFRQILLQQSIAGKTV
jgi:hypothetical protein